MAYLAKITDTGAAKLAAAQIPGGSNVSLTHIAEGDSSGNAVTPPDGEDCGMAAIGNRGDKLDLTFRQGAGLSICSRRSAADPRPQRRDVVRTAHRIECGHVDRRQYRRLPLRPARLAPAARGAQRRRGAGAAGGVVGQRQGIALPLDTAARKMAHMVADSRLPYSFTVASAPTSQVPTKAFSSAGYTSTTVL